MDEELYYSYGPVEWEYEQLGEVVTFQGGSQPPKKYFSNEMSEGMIRLIQIRDYKTNSYTTYVPKELCRRFCDKEDIMIGRYGPPIFQILRGIEGAYNVALIKAIPNEERLNKQYLYYFIKNEHLFKLIDGLSQRTSGQTGIDMEVLKRYIIPIPPRDEQEKIASILSTVDEQIDNVDGLIKKNKELKKGLMQQLLTKGIGHTKFKKTEIGEIPEEWEVKLLGELSQFIGSGVTPKGGENVYKDSGIPFIRSQNVYPNRLILENVVFIDEAQHEKMKRTEVMERDVLLNITGASIGRCTDVPVGFYKGNVNQHVCIIRLNEYANERFISTTINSPLVKKQIDSFNGGSSREGLNFQQVRAIKIGVPGIKEQVRIATIISEVDNKIEEYEVNKKKLERLKKGLMQQLLTGKIRVI